MTPNALMAVTPISVTNSLDSLTGCYFYYVTCLIPDNTFDPLIEIKELAFRYEDSRRFHKTCCIYFKGEPTAFIQNAGREGDDFSKLLFIDKDTHKAMDEHLIDLYGIGPDKSVDTNLYVNPNIDLETDLPELTEYYFETVDPM